MSFRSRKPKAKIIAQREDEEEDTGPVAADTPATVVTGAEESPATMASPASTIIKKKTKRPTAGLSKMSFGGDEEEADTGIPSFIPKKSALSQSTTSLRKLTLSTPTSSPTASTTAPSAAVRSAYTKSYLSELASSTPNTPKAFSTPGATGDALDIEAKFGRGAGVKPVEILDEGIVRELKARRARAARLGQVIAHSNDVEDEDDDENRVEGREVFIPLRETKKERRLQREDDDVLGDGTEGIEGYVEHPIILSRDAHRLEARRLRSEIRDALEPCTDDEEVEAEDPEWEWAQLRRTLPPTSSMRHPSSRSHLVAPPITTPLPTLSAALARLRKTLEGMKEGRDKHVKELERLGVERGEVTQREEEVGKGLEGVGREYVGLRGSMGVIDTVEGKGKDGVAGVEGVESNGGTGDVMDVEVGVEA
ncbi:hypothetical protein SAICODRAFT_138849 [Saitoella complicata NRRL Y-17804]|uniref:Uncharacterized protein n=1 Tax=Saitoella complicata (strain BCRC 22490 / CBS 7301 / JCM 7358 / NBRC 10748 / NRRL Y-17804) TaxID=698492 RepID=A0A0E9NQS2_SAICN|nr:uncharacterized protein SAICODRAFT_138849 [Saitoella complicata NRRL Y-17804]ODQ51866.1 hypothetical protein SAICODRAFT_138849 [Saitoella complicata NRRL Y-17804]GAO51770.1 hypothetical protein G7K_5863-t1 [Saitoella complicata NRRL Y-17804]